MTLSIQNPARSFEASLAAREAELLAMSPSTLRPIRADVEEMGTTVLGCMPDLRAIRPQIDQMCGVAFGALVDRIEVTAEAMIAAHHRHRIDHVGEPDEALLEEVRRLREVLIAEVRTLIARGYLPESALAALVGGNSHRGKASDLALVVRILRAAWGSLAGKTLVTEAELTAAENLANQLFRAVGERDQVERSTKSGELRIRSYTMLLAEHDQLKRAVTFVRWNEGDADAILPSLFAGRGRRPEEPEPESPPVAPVNGDAPSPAFEP